MKVSATTLALVASASSVSATFLPTGHYSLPALPPIPTKVYPSGGWPAGGWGGAGGGSGGGSWSTDCSTAKPVVSLPPPPPPPALPVETPCTTSVEVPIPVLVSAPPPEVSIPAIPVESPAPIYTSLLVAPP